MQFIILGAVSFLEYSEIFSIRIVQTTMKFKVGIEEGRK